MHLFTSYEVHPPLAVRPTTLRRPAAERALPLSAIKVPRRPPGCIMSTSQRIGCIGCAPLLAILRPTLAEDDIEAPTAAPMTACPVPPAAWLWLQLPWLYYFDHQLTH